MTRCWWPLANAQWSITDHRLSLIDHRSSAIAHRPSAIDHRPSNTDHRPSNTDHRSGYTLIELSVVMTILAVLISSGLGMYQRRDEATKHRETLARMLELEDALQHFVDRNGYLPCPAPGSATHERAYSVGEERYFAGEAVPYDAEQHRCSALETVEGGETFRGTVPVRTLGLRDEMMLDGWGMKITYELSPGLGNAEDFIDDSQFPGSLTVLDSNDRPLISGEEAGSYGAAYVLVSHGQNRAYGWMRGGGQQGAPLLPAPMEEQNSDDGNQTYRQVPRAKDFDDIVLFRTKADLVPARRLVSPIILTETMCERARRIVESTLYPYAAPTAFPENAAVIEKTAFALYRLCQKGAAPLEEVCARNLVYEEQDDGSYACVCVDDDKRLTTIPGVKPFGACLER